jgi:hypothetical protein
MKFIITLRVRNTELLNFKASGICSYLLIERFELLVKLGSLETQEK